MSDAKEQRAFVRREFLQDGKGRPAVMVAIERNYLRTIIENWVDKHNIIADAPHGPASVADDLMDHILDECENVDNCEDEDDGE